MEKPFLLLTLSLLITWKSIGAVKGVSRTVNSPNIPDELREFAKGNGYICGLRSQYSVIHFGFSGSDIHPVYYLNATADKLKEKGFNIIVEEVKGDVLFKFTYYNQTFMDTLSFDYIAVVSGIGGKPAPIARSYYMAQLGHKTSTGIKWLCDGVLINLQWVLSAAHCFLRSGSTPNILRLGDYNLTDPRDPHQTAGDKFVKDYPITTVIPHPEFKVTERYHDLVLIPLPERIPKLLHNIHPICLPWDEESDQNLVGKDVALTGWGATRYGGPKTTDLQEVYLKVFTTSVCNKSYARLRDTKQKFPNGLNDETTLCVGWEEDGRDACGGDSGAPVVYDTGENYVLAGIVSVGYGCGQKEYPGLYIPINKPKYLQWIKDVAFAEYN